MTPVVSLTCMGWQMIVRGVVSPSPWSSYCRLSNTPSPHVRELDDTVFKMEYELQRKERKGLTALARSHQLFTVLFMLKLNRSMGISTKDCLVTWCLGT